MGGGLMQLVAYGAQDIYLTGNPQITFFKVVYRRHTNFAVEAIEQTFNGSATLGSKFSCTISRNGDLLNRIYLECDLKAPVITSDLTTSAVSGVNGVDATAAVMTMTISGTAIKILDTMAMTVNTSNLYLHEFTADHATAAAAVAEYVSAWNSVAVTASDTSALIAKRANFIAYSGLPGMPAGEVKLVAKPTSLGVLSGTSGTGAVGRVGGSSNISTPTSGTGFASLVNGVDAIASTTIMTIAGSAIEVGDKMTMTVVTGTTLTYTFTTTDLATGNDETTAAARFAAVWNAAASPMSDFTAVPSTGEVTITQNTAANLTVTNTGSVTPFNSVSTQYGFGLINYVEVEIGGQCIDKHYGDWMKIWTDLTHDSDKSNMLSNMMPSNASSGVKNYIPLQFWFCRNPGLSLPLIALQYHEVKLNSIAPHLVYSTT